MRRDVNYMKPSRFRDYLTLGELCREVGRDSKWIRMLEKADRIPKPARVNVGSNSVRLYSPAQVAEIKSILSTMRPGRPRKDA